MKTSILISIGLLSGCLTALAQFSSGSTGTVALTISADTTIDLPPNGILHYTTITVESNVTLRFNRNSNNTPVYLLAKGDVDIRGTIDVSGGNATISIPREPGRGGPGGFDGGWPGSGDVPAGAGYGPGGGKPGTYDGNGNAIYNELQTAGAGSYRDRARNYFDDGFNRFGYASTNKGISYGSPLLVPLLGGSGGGGFLGTPGFTLGVGGGGGGGAILIASSTRVIVSGGIKADGGEGLTNRFSSVGLDHLNPGSGGAIRLVSPVVEGRGILSANGPSVQNVPNNFGRIRIDCIDQRNLSGITSIPSDRSEGNYLVIFPTPTPRLDLIHVAGSNIVQNFGPVTIQIPNGSSTNQPITVRAENFGKIVPIQIVLTPQNGSSATYTTNIDNSAMGAATVTVNVNVPVSTPVTVSAWTKVP